MNTLKPNDIVLGYTLRSRIGAGGYGEVWSAEAPGGIIKAIKFVYGYYDDERAKSELKSLDRIKTVRHPFLLSLERIQVVSGQLVVITELADKSLADLYKEYQDQELPGIPRDELIKYMRDVSDGLDYLAQDHNLQHLDIKPENLLLLSGHVKIADFGLVKDLLCATQSLMSGLTPLYAPPELFDGRPHRNSDQYSLAIVYAEMLTGNRPFNGSTPAQLAAQHINGKPALQALPAGDQQVILRALSKDPNVRFPSCRDMIDELADRKSRTSTKKSRNAGLVQQHSSETRVIEELQRRDMTAVVSDSKLPHLNSRLETLGPLELGSDPASIGPTLVIGIGRFGAMVVKRIRRQLTQQFGGAGDTPCIGLLAIDTDRQFLSNLSNEPSADCLGISETLPIPLKTPEQYRNQKKLRLDWISRRWIYNIPRSGQTEGLRPLGRLAFADHSEAIFRRLKDSISEILKPENVAATAERIGAEAQPTKARVFLIGSSSGGVASGSIIDLAFAVRTIFSEYGEDAVEIIGLLAHCTPRGNETQLLAIANTLGLLTEMRYINQFGYPGDTAIGLPDFADELVFDYTYMLHLGDGMSNHALTEGATSIARYIFLNACSQCQAFFEKCRAESPGEAALRSLQIKAFGLGSGSGFEQLSQTLVARMGQRWVGKFEGDPPESIAANLAKIQGDLGTSPEALVQKCGEIAQPFASAVEQEIEASFQSALSTQTAGEIQPLFQRLLLRLDELVGDGSSDLTRQIAKAKTDFEQSGQAAGQALTSQVIEMISDATLRLNGAQAIAAGLIHQYRAAGQGMQEQLRSANQALQAAEKAVRLTFTAKRVGSPQLQIALKDWRHAFVEQFRSRVVGQFMVAQTSKIVGQLLEAETQIASWISDLQKRLVGTVPNKSPRDASDFPTTQILAGLDVRLSELADRADVNLQHGWFQEVGGLAHVIGDIGLKSRLADEVIIACNQVISNAQNELRLEQIAEAASLNPGALRDWLAAQVAEARPQLTECGGQMRTLIGHAFHPDSLPTFLSALNHLDSCKPTIVRHQNGDLVICQELQQVTLANFVYRLMEVRADAIDLVGRLHTRTDIDWTSLNELFQHA